MGLLYLTSRIGLLPKLPPPPPLGSGLTDLPWAYFKERFTPPSPTLGLGLENFHGLNVSHFKDRFTPQPPTPTFRFRVRKPAMGLLYLTSRIGSIPPPPTNRFRVRKYAMGLLYFTSRIGSLPMLPQPLGSGLTNLLWAYCTSLQG